MVRLLYIGAAGAVGSVLRYLLSSWVQRGSGTFPIGTLVVNILGCLAIGFLSERLAPEAVNPHIRVAVLVGLIGGFTTFSAFSLETLKLIEQGRSGLAVLNVLVSVSSCILGVWLGMRMARGFMSA